MTDGRQQIPVTPQHIKISRDNTTGAMLITDNAHYKIHAGLSFTTDYTISIPSGAFIDILVITPNTTRWAHMEYILTCQQPGELKIYEGATTSNDGTGLTVFNRNRNSANAATTVVYHTPTVTTTGALIRTKRLVVDMTVGGESRDLAEFILKQNTKYLFRITNLAASGNYITLILSWYEHANI